MLRERLEDLSVNYYIKDLFSSTPFVEIVDGFPTKDLTVPSISVEAGDIDTEPFELGNKDRLSYRIWYIDVFATNKTQRDEFGYQILNALENSIPVYNYNDGFPPTVSPTQLGCLEVEPHGLSMEIIRVFPQLTGKLYWRCTVVYKAHFNQA